MEQFCIYQLLINIVATLTISINFGIASAFVFGSMHGFPDGMKYKFSLCYTLFIFIYFIYILDLTENPVQQRWFE